MQPIIQVQNITKKFGNFTAVSNLSFTVYKQDIYGFLGQNGAGKSTTMRMLLTLIKPTEGNIIINDLPLQKNRTTILKSIGALIEKSDVYKYLSAYENLELFARLSGLKLPNQQLMQQLDVVGLSHVPNKKVKEFSQGMKQRLGIAIALVHNPEIVILDEPTNGLDPQGIADIRKLIKSLRDDFGKTVVVSSHLLSEIEQVATRILIIDKGQKLIEGTKNELLDPQQTVVEFETTHADEAKEMLIYSKWNSPTLSSFYNKVTLTVAYADIPALHKYLAEKNISVYSFHQRNNLEDYFLKLTSHHV